MLWIEKYRPKDCSDIVGQEQVIRHLVSFARSGSVPHLLLCGPHGTGKSASVECFANVLYGEDWRENTSIFNAAELFSMGKTYLEADERFAHIFRKDQSLITNIKQIIRWYVSMRPLNAEFKLMVFEDAQALTFEAQQALRRIMERYSTTCRFVFVTTNPSAIIPAIASRCLPLSYLPIETDIIRSCLEKILAQEGAGDRVQPDDRDLIAHAAQGDLRKAILYLQVAAESGREIDLAEISGSEIETVTGSAFAALRKGDYDTARRIAESMMIDYGLSGREVVRELRAAAKREYNHPGIAIELARADHRLGHAANEFVQIDALLADIIRRGFGEESSAAL
ncbi:AAA family ATPase [Methanoculleus sp. FWC-SCC1]|uniref:Replication factor C small subunit n=1 Tax=Methanoculleus frigidifontis TaxID=2584085 RepID=A0ABT8M6K1_9EURY|nr:AAA family ATPase [Methanoculleus sp. FWC-SCC1]MDN7023565.1 AAA family ATPase [Methanoculleus sp. FWC-SCC1]